MIWADRAGLGVWAIGMVAIALMFSAGALEPAFAPPPKVCTNPFAQYDSPPTCIMPGTESIDGWGNGDLRRQGGFQITAELAGKLTGFVVLPLWLVLRIVDFMFDGPSRRRRNMALPTRRAVPIYERAGR